MPVETFSRRAAQLLATTGPDGEIASAGLRLADAEWLACDDFSIARIAIYDWIRRRAFADVDFSEAPDADRWFVAVSARPAIAGIGEIGRGGTPRQASRGRHGYHQERLLLRTESGGRDVSLWVVAAARSTQRRCSA